MDGDKSRQQAIKHKGQVLRRKKQRMQALRLMRKSPVVAGGFQLLMDGSKAQSAADGQKEDKKEDKVVRERSSVSNCYSATPCGFACRPAPSQQRAVL